MLDRTIEPDIKDAVEFDLQLKPYTKFQLDNGVEVYSIDAGAQEVISVEMVFSAGNFFETQNIVAATANFLLKNGTSTKTAFQINEHFDYYGASLSRGCYNETATITLHSLSKHLSVLLPVMQEMLTDAVFPADELAIYKQNMKQRLEVNLKKCDYVAGRLIDAYLFGEQHPYGKYTSIIDYDALEQEQLKTFYATFYKAGHCTLFVAGKLPVDLQEQLNKTFGNLPLNKQKIEVPTIAQVRSTEKKYRIANDPNGVQGAIRIGRPFPTRKDPDFQKALVLNTLFGGFFGSRLMSNIREEKGYTYGIHSYVQNHIGETAWMISTEAGKDVCEPTIVEVYKEMEILCNEEVDADDLLLVKNYMLGSVLGELDGPFQIMSRWKNIILNGYDGDYFYNGINTIKNITPKEIQELANKYLQPADFYELVVV
jgi:zinc protease